MGRPVAAVVVMALVAAIVGACSRASAHDESTYLRRITEYTHELRHGEEQVDEEGVGDACLHKGDGQACGPYFEQLDAYASSVAAYRKNVSALQPPPKYGDWQARYVSFLDGLVVKLQTLIRALRNDGVTSLSAQSAADGLTSAAAQFRSSPQELTDLSKR
jgi:hypothetical protein